MANRLLLPLASPVLVTAAGAHVWGASMIWPADTGAWNAIVGAGVAITVVGGNALPVYGVVLLIFARRIANGSIRESLADLLLVVPPIAAFLCGAVVALGGSGPDRIATAMIFGLVALFVGYAYAAIIALTVVACDGAHSFRWPWRRGAAR